MAVGAAVLGVIGLQPDYFAANTLAMHGLYFSFDWTALVVIVLLFAQSVAATIRGPNRLIAAKRVGLRLPMIFARTNTSLRLRSLLHFAVAVVKRSKTVVPSTSTL